MLIASYGLSAYEYICHRNNYTAFTHVVVVVWGEGGIFSYNYNTELLMEKHNAMEFKQT